MATDLPPRDPQPARGPGRTLRIVLFVSLAINLLVAGLAVGTALSRQGGQPPARIGFDAGPLAQMLDPADRRSLAREIRRTPGLTPLRPDQRRRDFETMVALLRADPFDAAAMSAILANQREAGARIVTAAQEALVARLAEASPADRARYADRLEDSLDRRR